MTAGMDVAPDDQEIVTLDVGGTLMRTTRSTLVKDPRSMLARMFAHDAAMAPCPRSGRDTVSAHPFIDCNPVYFAVALDHLRHGTTHVDAGLVDGVRRAADYLGIESLMAACDASVESAHASDRRSTDERQHSAIKQEMSQLSNFIVTYNHYRDSQASLCWAQERHAQLHRMLCRMTPTCGTTACEAYSATSWGWWSVGGVALGAAVIGALCALAAKRR